MSNGPVVLARSRINTSGAKSAGWLYVAFTYSGRLKPVKTIWRHMDEISFSTYFY